LRLVAWALSTALAACWPTPVAAQQTDHPPAADAASQPTLYVTATAHLDTQWLWTIQTTIDEYIPATLRDNFALFEQYPNYVFSFEGAFRYMLAKEYYPEDYARLEKYIDEGRWHVCGSWVDAVDVNVPSPESLIRHVLYGNNYFEAEFGKRSCDVYLPDCFGFGYALPSVAAHCGLKGFSTQKLTWGSSIGIPFDLGVWEGVDGSTLVAALNPGAYVSNIRTDLSRDEEWLERITKLGQESGVYAGYKYFGVGDRGGAPDAESVSWLEQAIAADGPIRVRNAPADQIYRDLTPEQIAGLPRYKGEMLMTRHGTGCYTSQCAMKRWNRKNELLADAAERASVAADWLGGATYPREKLNEAWVRFLWHQFHDDLTGTSIPQAYPFSWNDEIIALNQFAAVLTNAVGAVARSLDTRVEGLPLVVFNPLAFEREGLVEATVRFPEGEPWTARVYDAAGREVPAQGRPGDRGEVQLAFTARAPSAGFAVYDVRPVTGRLSKAENIIVTPRSLENHRYRVRLDDNGDVAGIYDKRVGRELLSAPIRLALFHNTPDYWSEWEVRYEDIAAEPYAYVGGPAEINIVEDGPVKATIEVRRKAAGSTFIQRIGLAHGEVGDRVEFDTRVDWHTPTTLLKAVFPLAASNKTATYDLGFGTIDRPNNTEQKYEVPAQQWADLTHADRSFGVAILNDCKYGWDKPNDNRLRLTLVHCPNDVEKDMGWHRMCYAVCGHQGDWRDGQAIHQAAQLNQPLLAFQTMPHAGALGKRFSLLQVNTPQVFVRACKKAEKSDEVIVRVQEAHGLPARDVRISLGAPIVAAREVDGCEQPLRDMDVSGGQVRLELAPYQPRTLALTLARAPHQLALPTARPVPLPFDTDVVSFDADRSDGDFDGAGHTLPAELLPGTIVSEDTPFIVGPTSPGANNAVACCGQTITLPDSDADRVYILAAAANGPVTATFTVGGETVDQTVQDFTGWIGQSDSLVVNGEVVEAARMVPGFIHRDELAWVGTHRHDGPTERNEPYLFCYLFKYAIDLPPGATAVTLPDDERIRVLAMTAADNPNDDTRPAGRLYDHLAATRIQPPGGLFIESVRVELAADEKNTDIFYTLDGSEPDRGSTQYTGAFEIADDTTVAARALRGGVLDDRVTRATFTFTQPRPPTPEPPDLVAGLDYRYYEGEWDGLPDFDALTPADSGTTTTFDISPGQRDECYGLVLTGLVRVPGDGVYTFYAASDDGSRVYVGDAEVVDNDGLHGRRERFGRIALAEGLHPISVVYFQRGGGAALEISYQGPGVPKQPIPSEALFHRGDGKAGLPWR
jgi:alpha-mannosidase